MIFNIKTEKQGIFTLFGNYYKVLLKLAILAFLLFKISIPAHAQEEFSIESVDNTVKVVQPSPTAASLGQYGSYPVSGSSGLPSISIPLFEVKGTEMSIPISLSYHGDGVKVDEIASWVGMGWSLNVGGVITRSIVGFPDESGKGIYDLYKTQGFTPNNPDDGYSLGWDMMYNLSSGLQKGEPDIYSYNFLGYSGQFFIDHNENIYHYNQADLKISRTISTGDISQFKVNVGDGTTLIFSAIETVSVDAGGQGSYFDEEVAWYLTSVVKGKDVFTFSYDEETINEGFSCSEVGSMAFTNGAGACLNVIDRQIVQGSVTTKVKQRLKSITGPFGMAVFHESIEDRMDLEGGKKLESLTYLDQTVLFKSRFTKGIHKPSINCQNINGTGTGIRERLFLDEVEHFAGNDSKRYLMEYETPDLLPPTKSFDQDHWGYYNSAGNITLLPDIDGYNVGGDREANDATMIFGTLKKITYPTGGYSEFNWEPNRKCESENMLVEVCNILIDFQLYGNDPDPFGAGEIIETPFTLNEVSSIHFNINVGHAAQNPDEPGSVFLTVKKSNGTILHSQLHEFDDNQTFTFNDLAAGNYIVELENRSPILDEVRFFLKECHNEMQTVTTCQYYGGLRIDEIINYSAIDDEFNTKAFMYGEVTSSRIMTKEGYQKAIKQICSTGGGSSAEYTAYKRHDRSLLQYSSSVTYDNIIELLSNSGRIVYEYYTLNDNWGGNSYEAILLQDHSWKRNLLKRKSVYDQNGSPVSETTHQYSFMSNFIYKGIKVDLILWNPINGGNGDHEYAIGPYNMYADWARLDYTIETFFYPDGNLTKRKDYEYYHPDDLVMPNLITTTSSNGQTVTAITLYPNSYQNVGTLWENLKEKYFYNPIEKVILRSDGITKGSLFSYDQNGDLISNRILERESPLPISDFDYSNQAGPAGKGYFLPSEAYHAENEIDLSYINKLLVNKHSRAGLDVTYLWGYNGKYPVAEITNLSRDQLVALIGQSTIDQIENSTDNGFLKTQLSDIQTQLPQTTQSTCYLYEPGIGVVEVINSNGKSINYSYDEFGRLKTISDKDGNLLSSYEYQYSLENK